MNKKTHNLTHQERLEFSLAGEHVDRIPVAFWRHFPVDDQNPSTLAAATNAFQANFDLDVVKVSPASSFCIKDWGVISEWRGNPEGSREYTHRIIHTPEDWLKLKPLSPNKGSLADQIECLKLINKELQPGTPFIQTIFNPLAQAKNLVGPEDLAVHARKYPDALMEGLKVIQTTILDFIRQIKTTGIAGIFLALQHASYNHFSEDEYDRFSTPFDLEILSEVKDLWLNMAHIHGRNIMFNKIAAYPVQILNWHDQETSPGLGEAQKVFPNLVCGGLHTMETLVLGSPIKIKGEFEAAYNQTGGKRFIFGTGCVTPLNTPYGNLRIACDLAKMSG